MRPTEPRLLKLFLSLFSFIFFQSAFAQTGSVTGMLTDNAGETLYGASVVVKGTTLGITSDQDGSFSIFKISVGEQHLIITYLGFQPDTIQIEISGGVALQLGKIVLQEDHKKLDEVIVKSELEKGSEEKAISITKNSAQVVTVLSQESMSKLPDKNAAESVKRIAGAAVQNNKGEGANISLRGTPHDWTATMINGDRLPVADEENTTRIFEFEVLPSELIDYVVVSRTVTPDLEGDNVGGVINFLTRTSVDKKTLEVDVAAGYSLLAQKPSGTINFLFGSRSKNEKFSYVVNTSWYGRYYAAHASKLAFGSNFNHGLNRLELKDYDGLRNTIGANVAWEYKPNNRIRLGQKMMFGSMLDDKWQRKTMYVYDSGDGKSVRLQSLHGKLNRYLTGGEFFSNFFVSDKFTIDARVSGYYNRFSYGNAPYNSKDERNGYYTQEFGLRNVFVFTDIDSVDLYGNAYTGAEGQYPFPTKLIEDDNPYGRGDDYRDIQPQITTPLIADSFEFKRAFSELNTTWESDPFIGQLDFHYKLNEKIELKAGGKFRLKIGERNISFHEWLLNITSQSSAEPIYMMDMETDPFDEKGGFLKEYGSPYEGTFMPFLTKEQSEKFLEQYGGRLREREMNDKHPSFREWVGSSYKYREYSSAGYMMADARVSKKVQLVGGLRLEHTSMHVESDTLSTAFQIDTALGVVYYPSEPRSTDIKYLAVLPALNINVALNEKSNLRSAISRTYHRQNFAEVKPGFAVIRYNEFEFIFGNPELKPAYSFNLDMMYEFFWGNKGMFSIGGYYKHVTDHIFATTRSDYDQRTGIVFKSYENAGKSWVAGLEGSIQRKFDFLPKFLSGFGINANVTFSVSRMQVPGRDEKQPMAEQSPLLYNIALFYEKHGVDASIALNYTGDYLKELNLAAVKDIGLLHKNTDFDVFQAETYSLDFKCGYSFKKHYTIYVELNNLLDYPFIEYRGKYERPVLTEFYRQKGQVGFRFEM